jgi:hypothetical protein
MATIAACSSAGWCWYTNCRDAPARIKLWKRARQRGGVCVRVCVCVCVCVCVNNVKGYPGLRESQALQRDVLRAATATYSCAFETLGGALCERDCARWAGGRSQGLQE